MSELKTLVWRNTKLFFKDKGLFFTSLITPLILLVLYITFLGNVYRESLQSVLSAAGNMTIPDSLMNGCVGGQLFSSLLAVCCVTVAFCANMLMVQDKITGARIDLTMAPIKRTTLAISYYLATVITTLLVCLVAAGACMVYLGVVGWYLSFQDIMGLLLDILLLVFMGTALSSIVNFFLSSQGQMSAVGTIVSAGYGFICGAYMPISQFSDGIQKVVSLLPGTYGTALLRNHALTGVFKEMEALQVPTSVIDGMRDAIDCNLYCFGHGVSRSAMLLIVALAVVLFISIYIGMNYIKPKQK